MKEQLLLAWQIHNSKNFLLLNCLTPGLLQLPKQAKGRNVGEQLAHLHNIRLTWIEAVAKPLHQKDLVLPKKENFTVEELSAALKLSGEKIEAVINKSWEEGGKLPSFKTGLLSFVAYLISHESHHRGNILLTLKQSGEKLPDTLKWGLWEWTKP